VNLGPSPPSAPSLLESGAWSKEAQAPLHPPLPQNHHGPGREEGLRACLGRGGHLGAWSQLWVAVSSPPPGLETLLSRWVRGSPASHLPPHRPPAIPDPTAQSPLDSKPQTIASLPVGGTGASNDSPHVPFYQGTWVRTTKVTPTYRDPARHSTAWVHTCTHTHTHTHQPVHTLGHVPPATERVKSWGT
jgi:hypothetical protein